MLEIIVWSAWLITMMRKKGSTRLMEGGRAARMHGDENENATMKTSYEPNRTGFFTLQR
jgi:hypothetical protein